ncbi:1,4-dihydropyridine esterase [Streptomyces paludis]|uniref:1,4-dihydropyridine esterase n=2 Tax=Streptomyces paludis TaxID=2282738 RepID=A0A345HRH8_9ACTN|nr:1,4-dihydropyridine esterase [Streptomyces paludis]
MVTSSATAATATSADTSTAKTFGAQGNGTTSVVTLITGDQVHVDTHGKVVRVQRGEGRESVRISIRRIGDDTYVMPSDASLLVGQGRLDRRLFNVTGLLKAQYDDAHRATLPLIVSYAKNASRKAEAKAAIADADISVRRTLPAVSGEALTAPKDETADVWEALTAEGDPQSEAREAAPGIERVWLDGKRKALLDKSVPQIGAPTAWQAGYDGTGVKVAVLDTGVDQTHPDLKGVSILRKDFSGSGNTVDHSGHGTHVASTIAGSGAKSGGKYKGVAPGTKIIDAKVLDDDGFGEDSGIIAGMQWAADQGAKIANLSLGGEDTADVDPLEAAVDKISAEKNVLFVIAAGNEGPDAETIGSPGSAASALTVGAVDSKNKIAGFSSVGPTADGSLKPDITAPGVNIVAARAAKGVDGTPAAAGYVSMSGTSMATPHVAGAAAILAQQHPDWTGARIKQALVSSAKPTAGLTPYQQGTGRTDLTKAITQTVVSERSSVSFGTLLWPHTKPVTQQVTYRNDGTSPVTLDLSLEATGPKGKAAPAGFFALGAQQVTVPAGGTARVSLSANNIGGSASGGYAGAVVAKATEGGQSVRTSFAAQLETESYQLTLKYLDTKGKPSQSGSMVYGLANDFWAERYDTDGDGVVKLRVPKGTYALESQVQTPKGAKADPDVALMMQPKLNVTKNTTVTFDARKAKPISVTAPESAKSVHTYVRYDHTTAGRAYASTMDLGSFSGFRTGHVGPTVPAKEFGSQVGGTWQKGSTTYNVLYPRRGSLHTGFSHKINKGELALVKMKIGASAKNRLGSISPTWELPSEDGYQTVSKPFALPATAKTYVSAGKGIAWSFAAGQNVSKNSPELDVMLTQYGEKVYQPKKTYERTFNVGVFSPRIGSYSGAWRSGNDMWFCMPEFTDSSGNEGLSLTTKQRSFISVNGKKTVVSTLCGGEDIAGVPAKSAKYRIYTDASRSTKVAGVTTRLIADWAFTSKKPAAGKTATLPLSTVRFVPKLSLTSTAPAGKTFTVPLTLQGPAAKSFKSLAVQVSYDGGKKWSKAPVTTAKNGKKSLKLNHPKKAESVSFKAKLTDKSGNTYNVTVEKAYLLK